MSRKSEPFQVTMDLSKFFTESRHKGCNYWKKSEATLEGLLLAHLSDPWHAEYSHLRLFLILQVSLSNLKGHPPSLPFTNWSLLFL
jgi:hypothetical protein